MNISHLSFAVTAMAIVSCFFSSFVIITYAVFPDMRRKIFMKVSSCILFSIADGAEVSSIIIFITCSLYSTFPLAIFL